MENVQKIVKNAWFPPVLIIVLTFVFFHETSAQVLGIVVATVVAYMAYEKSKVQPVISCPNCKYVGPGKEVTEGSSAVELILYLCFIIPGLIYSSWRLSKRHLACPKCNFNNVVKQ